MVILLRDTRDRFAKKISLQTNCFSAKLLSMQAVLTMTQRGVISLPKKIRHLLGLHGDDHLIAEVTSQGLLLKQAVTLPVEMYSNTRIQEFDEGEAELAAMLKAKKKKIHRR